MPTSARRMAGASLAPSPAMATTRPARCSARTMRTFCAGRDAGEHRPCDRCASSSSSSVSCAELGAGEHSCAASSVELAGDRLGGARVVAGDHHGRRRRRRAAARARAPPTGAPGRRTRGSPGTTAPSAVRRRAGRRPADGALGDREHAQAAPRQPVAASRSERAALSSSSGARSSPRVASACTRQDGFGGALDAEQRAAVDAPEHGVVAAPGSNGSSEPRCQPGHRSPARTHAAPAPRAAAPRRSGRRAPRRSAGRAWRAARRRARRGAAWQRGQRLFGLAVARPAPARCGPRSRCRSCRRRSRRRGRAPRCCARCAPARRVATAARPRRAARRWRAAAAPRAPTATARLTPAPTRSSRRAPAQQAARRPAPTPAPSATGPGRDRSASAAAARRRSGPGSDAAFARRAAPRSRRRRRRPRPRRAPGRDGGPFVEHRGAVGDLGFEGRRGALGHRQRLAGQAGSVDLERHRPRRCGSRRAPRRRATGRPRRRRPGRPRRSPARRRCAARARGAWRCAQDRGWPARCGSAGRRRPRR